MGKKCRENFTRTPAYLMYQLQKSIKAEKLNEHSCIYCIIEMFYIHWYGTKKSLFGFLPGM